MLKLFVPSLAKYILPKEYDRLVGERNQICNKVLGAYLLVQKDDKFYLERADWKVFQFSVGFSTHKGNTGIDSSVERDKLPPVPPTGLDKGIG